MEIMKILADDNSRQFDQLLPEIITFCLDRFKFITNYETKNVFKIQTILKTFRLNHLKWYDYHFIPYYKVFQ